MSEPTVTKDTTLANPESSQLESEGTTFLSPPGFQLTAGAAASNSGPVQMAENEDEAPTPTTVDIQASVGAGGVNHASDVQQVQTRLIELGSMRADEAIDLSDKAADEVISESDMANIIRAITYFQRAIVGLSNPDGNIGANGGTERALNVTTRTADQVTQAVGGMMNHDRLDGKSIRIIQNVLGGRVDGDLLQDQALTGAWSHADETDSQTRIQNFQTAPTGYDNAPIADAPTNNDRSGVIEEGTINQVFSILVGANQHPYALYIVMDFYTDFPDAPGTADPQRLNLGNSLEVYYDANLAQASQSFEELGGLRTVAVGPTAFTNPAGLRTVLANAQTATLSQKPSGMTEAPSQEVDQTLVTDEGKTGINTALTEALITAAIAANSAKFNQSNSVRMIQDLVGAPITGTFDTATIRQIAYFQSAYSIGQTNAAPEGTTPDSIGASGILDPKTVDLMGRDMIARQEFNAAIQLAMDYFNIDIQEARAIPFGDHTDPTDNLHEVENSNITSIVYDPNLAEAWATDKDMNETDANVRIRDVRGIGGVRIGRAAFSSFVALTTAISQGMTDIARPGDGQLATEGTTRGLIPPLADMSTFQVPYTGNWKTNGGSGWLGATKGGRGGKHGGWDIYAPIGTPIRACADGVADTTVQGGYGDVVRLLADGRVYFYAHLSGYAIPNGVQTNVTQGQVLGYVGVAGNAAVQRPHLHFEVRSGDAITTGTRVDPDDYFTRPTKQRWYSAEHGDMIVTEIPNDTEFPYPTVNQAVPPTPEGGAEGEE